MLWFLLACHTPPESRVVVVGMDGLEYSLLDRMVATGDLPNFKALMDEGSRAEVTVTQPIMSPILWTTAASGYPAEVHGVGGWTSGNGASTAADVRVDRIWDVASAAKQEVVVVGWLMTWPAPAVRGALVSDRLVWNKPMNANASGAKREVDKALAFPDNIGARILALQPDEAWMKASKLGYQVESYGTMFHPMSRDETHIRAFEALWPEHHANFGAIYLNGADQESHLYWPFVDPPTLAEIKRDPALRAAQAQSLAAAHPERHAPPCADGNPACIEEATHYVPDYYRYLDSVLGRVRALLTPETTLIVMSDHGFRRSDAQPLLVGSHQPIAVFLTAGAKVKAGQKVQMHVFDIAPTLYALLNLPAAADMPGQVRSDLFDIQAQPPVATRVRTALQVSATPGGEAEGELLKELQSLGYLDAEGQVEIGASRKTQ